MNSSLAPRVGMRPRGISGRQGIRTPISRRKTALAVRPGKPYPATFRTKFVVERVVQSFPLSAEGEGVEPSRLIARPISNRVPSPFGLPFRIPDHHASERKSRTSAASTRLEWTAGESNPDFLVAGQASSRWTSSPSCLQKGPPENRTRSPSLPREECSEHTRGPFHRIQPSHEVIPEGVEPPFPLCKRGVVAIGPRDVCFAKNQ